MSPRRLRHSVIASLLIAAGLFVASFQSAGASLATTVTYNLSRQKISAAANHELRFKTPTGVDASTDTITITFPSGFSLASLNLTDFDLFHGATTGLETAETIALAPAAGAWGVSTSSVAVTFTAPTDAAAGEITANQFVVIRIGTNASGGVGQITNPSSVGVVNIALGGTFGDSATIGVPIISEDTVSVTASVPSPPAGGGGGGGGGGGVGDVVAPSIYNVQAINITTSTVLITWDTNESSNSAVDYGVTMGYGSGTVSNASYVTAHSIQLTQLSPNTTFHFRVSSRDLASNLGTSGDYTFTSLGVSAPPPVISGVQVVDITDVSARVIWNTDTLADSRVDYGTTTAYGLWQSDPGFVTAHTITLTGLSQNTVYHFFVTSKDQMNAAATSSDGTFMTLPDTTPPANAVSLHAVGGDGIVHLTWGLPTDPDFAGVRIVRKTDTYPTGPNDGTLVYLGTATSTDDTQVTNGVTYYYGAFSFDTNGNFASGALAMATPSGPQVAAENTEPLCSNGLDDDADGAADCADSECKPLPICAPPPQPVAENTNAACSNGFDDDADGAIDCADPDCVPLQVCAIPPTPLPTPPVPPTPLPTPGGQIIPFSSHFYGSDGTVELLPDAENKIHALAGDRVLLSVPVVGLAAEVEDAYLMGLSLYQLALNADGTALITTFVVPAAGSYNVAVILNFVGGGTSVANYTFVSQGGGRVVEENLAGKTDVGVSGASVTLYVDDGGWKKWNATPFNQSNPLAASEDGTFAFIVPQGRYYAEVEKDGYQKTVTTPIQISFGVFGEVIGLIAIPPKPEEVIAPGAPVLENVANIAKNILDQAIFGTTLIRATLQRPEVQQAVENVVSPAVLGVAFLNVASALPAFNALAYLQYLFTQPLLLIGRRKKKKWGIVYNSLTKQPVDLAIVRLLDATTRLVIQTKVTDKFGRYSFITKPGTYLVEVVKPGYVYPTQYLKDKTEDVDLPSLYHATPMTLSTDLIVAVNIPLDPVTPVETPRQVLWKKALRSLQQDLSFVTVIISLIALAIRPSIQVALITLSQIGLYLLFRRLSVRTKTKEWGIVFDSVSRQPVSRVIVRIFDKKFNKLLETQVTDANGKYGFFVRRNVYYVTAEKEGFEKYVSPDIDLSTKDEALVDQNIQLKSLK